MIRTLCSGGINWNWYVQADFNKADRTCHVYFHERWHKYENRGSNHPKSEWIDYQFLEDDKRTAYGLKVAGIEYLVTNPAQVFSYRDFTNIVSE